MTIGILECDHVRPELLYIGGDYRTMFSVLFAKTAPHWRFVFYDVINGHLPDAVTDCDAYICTGSRFSVYDNEPWIAALKGFVAAVAHSKQKFVGVCFGHQLLGGALGGRVQKATVGWCVGVHSFTVLKPQSYMVPPQAQVSLLMMCQDQIIALPPKALTLASTPDCPHAMIQIGDNLMGIQAHPEFSIAYETALINIRVERIGIEKSNLALQSLNQNIDNEIVTKWIVLFLDK
jgi:GMP synthase-like glutamine amidotransferase